MEMLLVQLSIHGAVKTAAREENTRITSIFHTLSFHPTLFRIVVCGCMA